jgi:hypothetical protein
MKQHWRNVEKAPNSGVFRERAEEYRMLADSFRSDNAPRLGVHPA